jgi:hypothetical protein
MLPLTGTTKTDHTKQDLASLALTLPPMQFAPSSQLQFDSARL